MRELELQCECQRLDCRVRLTIDDDDLLYVEMIMPRRTFLTRCQNAFNYVFRSGSLSVADVVVPWKHETIVSIRGFFG